MMLGNARGRERRVVDRDLVDAALEVTAPVALVEPDRERVLHRAEGSRVGHLPARGTVDEETKRRAVVGEDDVVPNIHLELRRQARVVGGTRDDARELRTRLL